jgi:hypothetical protein
MHLGCGAAGLYPSTPPTMDVPFLSIPTVFVSSIQPLIRHEDGPKKRKRDPRLLGPHIAASFASLRLHASSLLSSYVSFPVGFLCSLGRTRSIVSRSVGFGLTRALLPTTNHPPRKLPTSDRSWRYLGRFSPMPCPALLYPALPLFFFPSPA